MNDTTTAHPMLNSQKWCKKCGGFVEGIYAGNPTFCRCDPKADRIKELESEVARLKKELDAWDYGTRAKREQEVRKKVEANLRRVIEIAEEFRFLLSIRHRAELDAIRSSLPPANN